MTKTGGSRHQKRVAAPRNWPLPRKSHKFAVRTSPGPHNKENCIPLLVLLRDILHLAGNTREVKLILNKRLVKVDGRIVTARGFPVGLMDIVEIGKIDKTYQILPHKLHVLMPYETKKPTRITKLCQIMNKTTIKGGIMQLNLHDGRNILLPKEEGIEQRYKTHDVIEIILPSQEIVSHLPFEEGMYAIITAGRNVAKHGTIKEFHWRFGPRASTVSLESSDGSEVQTTPEYIFVIGKKSPMIPILES